MEPDMQKIRSYRRDTLIELSSLLCSESEGKRWEFDSAYAQAQPLVMMSLATMMDESGRGEWGTGGYTVTREYTESGMRVFSNNGFVYRFHTYEYPVFDTFMSAITNSENGGFYNLAPPSADLPEMSDELREELCKRSKEAILILDSYLERR